jgi:hypothetical protein
MAGVKRLDEPTARLKLWKSLAEQFASFAYYRKN